MITKQEPAQPKLWSRFQDLLSEAALEELDRGLAGRIPPDDTEAAADRTHGGEIQQIHRVPDQGAVFGVRLAPDHELFRVDAVADEDELHGRFRRHLNGKTKI